MDYLRNLEKEQAVLSSRYAIVKTLNQGSFGTVVKAFDKITKRHVAIKFIPLPEHGAADTSDLDVKVDELSEELAAHGAVTGSYKVVSMLDTFQVEGHKCLVMEYCDSGDLFEWIKAANQDRLDGKRGILSVEEARDVMVQLVDCVDYIHSKGVYHRDLKPENVLIGDDGRLKLADFGLATFSPRSFEVRLGSDKYMAPEQYSNPTGSYDSAKVDIWALGICIGNLLFDSHPFALADESNSLFRDYCADRQSLYTTFPNLAPGGFDVISLCLKPDADSRDLAQVRRAIMAASCFTVDQEISLIQSSPAQSQYGLADWRNATSGLSTRVQSAAVSFRDSAIGSFGTSKRPIAFDSPFPTVSDSVPIVGARSLLAGGQSVSWADIDADNDADFDDIVGLGSYWSSRTPLSTIDDAAETFADDVAVVDSDEPDEAVFVIEDIPAAPVAEPVVTPRNEAAVDDAVAGLAPIVTVETAPKAYVARPGAAASGGLRKWSKLGQTRQAASPETKPTSSALAAHWTGSPTLKRARRPSDSRQTRSRPMHHHPSAMASDWRSTPKSHRVVRPAGYSYQGSSPALSSVHGAADPSSKRRPFGAYDGLSSGRRTGPAFAHVSSRAGVNGRRNSGATPFWLSSFRSSMTVQVS